MRELIKSILENYNKFRQTEAFKGTHDINQYFSELRSEVESLAVVRSNSNLIVKSSYGKGNWAAVPWLSILDTRETSTTQDGTYVVILFSEDGRSCQIKLAQGVTQVKSQFKRKAPEELKRRADRIRTEIQSPELEDFLPSAKDFDLGSTSLARLYETSTIFSKEYDVDDLPSDEVLESVITHLVNAYQTYISNRLNKVDDAPEDSESAFRAWALAAGEAGHKWKEFLGNGEIAIGWPQIEDLMAYETQEQIHNELMDKMGGNPSNDSLCCYQFAHEMSVGDIIVAKSGRKKIFGMGRIVSEYYWDQAAPDFKHRRKVEWLRTDPTEFPGTGTATKTLTEITQYPTFMLLVRDYLELNDADAVESEDDDSDYEEYTAQSIIAEGSFLSR